MVTFLMVAVPFMVMRRIPTVCLKLSAAPLAALATKGTPIFMNPVVWEVEGAATILIFRVPLPYSSYWEVDELRYG